MGLVVFFGIDKAPLSDVSELFLREIKWTANPDDSLTMPTPPTKQPKTGPRDPSPPYGTFNTARSNQGDSESLIMSILDILVPFPSILLCI
jgi:hypothetical protein